MTGNLFIIAAPSGAGKSSLVGAVMARDDSLSLSVSYTTRAPRPGEQDGREYHFVDPETFLSMLERAEFLESAEVHGNHYGTSQKWVAEARASGRDILLEIDWQGAQQVRRVFPEAVSLFILPPSMAELERRLRSRGKDSDDVIRRRLINAREEMAHVAEFDYVIINNEFETATKDLAAVIRAARLHTPDVLSANAERLSGLFGSRPQKD
ncbi:MAG: guanylate kinase [Betaproteobacteria bacterium]|nr:guanylate kinase [Betaproteobacteria bacterium]